MSCGWMSVFVAIVAIVAIVVVVVAVVVVVVVVVAEVKVAVVKEGAGGKEKAHKSTGKFDDKPL